MKILSLLLALLLTGCSGGPLVYRDMTGKVHKITVQDADISERGLVRYQDDAGKWHMDKCSYGYYKGYRGDCCK